MLEHVCFLFIYYFGFYCTVLSLKLQMLPPISLVLSNNTVNV